MNKIIDGTIIAKNIKQIVKSEIETLKNRGINLTLAVIRVGNDKASEIYVRNKKRACEEVGMKSFEYVFDENIQEKELLNLIYKLNKNQNINGILVQLPLPEQIHEKTVIEAISKQKDVDCFSCENTGTLMQGNAKVFPCTPCGIIKMLEFEGIELEGKHCVVIGRSNIVGKPISMLLLSKNATVTMCHSKTKNLADITKLADIIVIAIGKARFLKENMVKDGCVVIDVGMNRDENNKLCGDADFENLLPKVSKISKVPGGVGPMTVAMLMYNTLQLTKIQNNL